eukprot:scaffold2095_cov166-Amphora_coffeaeformis.AAC.15
MPGISIFANRPPPKSGGNGKDGRPNDGDASNAEKPRVAFVDGTKLNKETKEVPPRKPMPTPRLDLDASSTGFGSGLSSFGNSDGGFGGFGSSFGSPSSQNPPAASGGGISIFQNRGVKARPPPPPPPPPPPLATNESSGVEQKSATQAVHFDRCRGHSNAGESLALPGGIGGIPVPQKTDAKNTTETAKSKDSLPEPSQGAIPQLTCKVKTRSGNYVDVTSSLDVAGGGGSIGALLQARKYATKSATSTISTPPRRPVEKISEGMQISHMYQNNSEPRRAASVFQGSVSAKYKKAPTAQPAGNKTAMARSPAFGDSLCDGKSTGGPNPTTKASNEKSSITQPTANLPVLAPSPMEHASSKSSQAFDTKPSMLTPTKPPLTEQYSPMSPTFLVESVSSGHGTFEHELTPLSSNRTKMVASNVNRLSEQNEACVEHAGQHPHGKYQTPRRFSNQTKRIDAEVSKVNEYVKPDGFEAETPSLADASTMTSHVSHAWGQENLVLQAKAPVAKPTVSADVSRSSVYSALSEENKYSDSNPSSNVVTPGSNVNQMDLEDGNVHDGSLQENEGDESKSEDPIDWEGMQGDFKQKMQGCDDILQVFNFDMLGAMETLEAAHADLQIMECNVLDQISKMEELEAFMDNLIESYETF